MKHVIRTQIFEVVTNKKDDAFELQQRMSELFYSVILPVIEKTFDELAPGQEYIYLDKVEVDLGRICIGDLASKSWEIEFREIFSRQFRDQLNITKEKKIGLPISYSITQQWIYYMKKGYLPWNATTTGEEWYLKVLEGLAQDYKTIEELRELIRTDRRAVRRMVLLHDVVFLMHLVEVLTAVKQVQLQRMISFIIESISIHTPPELQHASSVIIQRRFWEAILNAIVTRKNVVQPLEIIEEILQQVFTKPELENLYKNVSTEEDLHKKIIADEELRPLLTILKKKVEVEASVLVKKQEEKDTSNVQQKKEQSNDLIEGLFVSNAGLVILHPFLNRFFTYLDLVSEYKFVTEKARHQAMILMHYLAVGSIEFEEHQLVIPKCLCNYELLETVDPLILPTAEMISECDELLKDVVAQWTVLKNTSPGGLRVNFLQRAGKLYTKNDEPHLLVEASAFDVLLDKLPWSITMIRLPWMKKMLKVEWR